MEWKVREESNSCHVTLLQSGYDSNLWEILRKLWSVSLTDDLMRILSWFLLLHKEA
jgi:hypothetical protein